MMRLAAAAASVKTASPAAAIARGTPRPAIVRAIRAAVAVLVVVRTATEFRVLFTRRGAPMLTGIAFTILLIFGGLFYWLDPAIKTFWDGLRDSRHPETRVA